MQMNRFTLSQLFRSVWLSCTLTASSVAFGSEVPDLVSFMPGTPARASEVNNNFNALRTAVNDNHARLTAAESAAQAEGIRLDALDASLQALQSALAAQQTQTTNELAGLRAEMRAPGVISVSAQAFTSLAGNPCTYVPQSTAGYFDGAPATICGAAASVNLPHGAQVTAVQCSSRDNGDGKINVYELIRSGLADESTGSLWSLWNADAIALTPGLVNASLGLGAVEPALIDNSAYIYFLSLYGHASSTPESIRFYGCAIHYEYPE